MPEFEIHYRLKHINVTPAEGSYELTIDDMIRALEANVAWLREMKDAGVVLAEHSAPDDDYWFFRTEDPKVADRFDMDEIEFDEEEEEGEVPEEVVELRNALVAKLRVLHGHPRRPDHPSLFDHQRSDGGQ
jgi:hypothetical protein